MITTRGDWSDHLEKLELTIKKLKYNGIEFNIKKSIFGKTNMEYLDFWMTWNGIRLTNYKVEAIINMTLLKN